MAQHARSHFLAHDFIRRFDGVGGGEDDGDKNAVAAVVDMLRRTREVGSSGVETMSSRRLGHGEPMKRDNSRHTGP